MSIIRSPYSLDLAYLFCSWLGSYPEFTSLATSEKKKKKSVTFNHHLNIGLRQHGKRI